MKRLYTKKILVSIFLQGTNSNKSHISLKKVFWQQFRRWSYSSNSHASPLISDESSSDSDDSSDCETTPVKRIRIVPYNNAYGNRYKFSPSRVTTPQQRKQRAGYTREKIADIRATPAL